MISNLIYYPNATTNKNKNYRPKRQHRRLGKPPGLDHYDVESV
jgi:hypothetical protein